MTAAPHYFIDMVLFVQICVCGWRDVSYHISHNIQPDSLNNWPTEELVSRAEFLTAAVGQKSTRLAPSSMLPREDITSDQ